MEDPSTMLGERPVSRCLRPQAAGPTHDRVVQPLWCVRTLPRGKKGGFRPGGGETRQKTRLEHSDLLVKRWRVKASSATLVARIKPLDAYDGGMMSVSPARADGYMCIIADWCYCLGDLSLPVRPAVGDGLGCHWGGRWAQQVELNNKEP